MRNRTRKSEAADLVQQVMLVTEPEFQPPGQHETCLPTLVKIELGARGAESDPPLRAEWADQAVACFLAE